MRSSPVMAPPSLVATIFFSRLLELRAPRLRASPPARRRRRAPCARSSSAAARRRRCGRRARSSRRTARARASRRRTAPCGPPSLYGARRSRPTSSFVSMTSLPLVSRTVYVPGSTRGPCDALNATCAARGTRGGLTCIVHDHAVDAAPLGRRRACRRACPRVEHLELERPEQVARALVVGDDRAARRVLARRRWRRPRPSRPAPASAAAPAAPAGTPPASRSVSRRQRAQRREVVDDPDAAAVRRDHQVAVARLDLQVAHGDAREVAALELRPASRRRRARSRGRTRCPGRAACGFDRVLLDDVRVAAHALLGATMRVQVLP